MGKRSLGFKLVAGGVAIVLIPLLVVGIFSAISSSKALETSAKERALNVAQNLADMTQLILLEEIKLVTDLSVKNSVVDTATRVAAAGAGGAAGDIERLSSELSRSMKKIGNDYEVIFIADLNGTIYADSLEGKYKGIVVGERDYFLEAKSGKVNVGQPVKSKASGKPIVPFGAPVYSRNGEVVGVAATILKTDFLVEKIASVKIGTTGYPWMIERKGMVIAHPKKEFLLELDATKLEGMEGIVKKMLAHQSGIDTYVFKGVKKIAGFAPVPASGWAIGVTQDADEFLAASHRIRNIILIAGALFLFLTVAVVLFFSRGITRPMMTSAEALNEAADQVASASSQVSTASQSLAEGASESASSIEETSSSLEEMSSMTKHNADNANQAKALMSQAAQIVERVDKHMKEMASSITEITKSSEETSKIIKTIDEISFQTNLLALNAAVEAARAGEAGAGFSVVADEVRNLAIRAADAAKSTSGLIENTIKSVRSGNELTQLTQEAFRENMEIAGKIGNLVDEIAAASQEQAQGIDQINKAVTEMDKVTQQNAANAEESASASEEMNAQAMQMKQVAGSLVTLVNGGTNGSNGKGAGDSASRGMEDPKTNLVRALARVVPGKVHKAASLARKEVQPGKIIPLDEKDFKSF